MDDPSHAAPSGTDARPSADARPRDCSDVDLAVGWLAERYTMTERSARILLAQVARQDRVSEADAAHRLVDTGDRSSQSRVFDA